MPHASSLNQKLSLRIILIAVALLFLGGWLLLVEQNKSFHPTKINLKLIPATTPPSTDSTLSTSSGQASSSQASPTSEIRNPKSDIRHLTSDLITEPQDGIAPVLAMIGGAKRSVDLVIYELSDQKIEQALADAQARGLAVRVLLDPGYYGKPEYYNQAAYDYFSARQIPVHWAPAYFTLTHQKTLIIDQQAALIMTFNLTPKYYPTDRDFGVIDEDAADVTEIENNFAADWNNQKIPNSQNQNDLIWSPNAQSKIINLINSAKTSLQVYNEEMADPAVEQALKKAAARKVQVQVVMTDSKDWQADWQTLTADQVQVRTYAADALLYVHAKMIIVDDRQAFVGSQNFSDNSLNANRELGIITTDPTIVNSLNKTFVADWNGATLFVSR